MKKIYLSLFVIIILFNTSTKAQVSSLSIDGKLISNVKASAGIEKILSNQRVAIVFSNDVSSVTINFNYKSVEG